MKQGRIAELAKHGLRYADREEIAFTYADRREREVWLGIVVAVLQLVIGNWRLKFIAQIVNVTLDGFGADFPFFGETHAIRVCAFLDLAINKQKSPILGFELLHSRSPLLPASSGMQGCFARTECFLKYFPPGRHMSVPPVIESLMNR